MARETYAQRIERGMATYYAANPGATEQEARQFARGHGHTGEHGVTVTQVGQDVIVSFRDPHKLEQAMRAAEKYGERANVAITGKNGESVVAFENKGHVAGRTLESIKTLAEESGDGLWGAVAASGDHYELAGIGSAAGVSEYQLIVH